MLVSIGEKHTRRTAFFQDYLWISPKAQEGLRDVIGNISGHDIPRPLSVRTKDVVNANCMACHSQTNVNVASMDAKPYCVDCHRGIAHMRMMPISTRTVAND